jgi:hypothetical protein
MNIIYILIERLVIFMFDITIFVNRFDKILIAELKIHMREILRLTRYFSNFIHYSALIIYCDAIIIFNLNNFTVYIITMYK